ncbi:uncharacterized protein LOC124449762 [Xenia sp. Carnegie-2017]|uniref:uncharacterized protein LOC124449762 n=1 Tax=Xenia sp. Carnegie-2017 TaxID=2897299 RepID=UPI001F03DB93|nr:uncharacterized protein LOC124449762 [Xenia sp. Carnegie-2017]
MMRMRHMGQQIRAKLPTPLHKHSMLRPQHPQASKTKGVRCYLHQTWSDYENGHRGLLLGITMMSLCFIEILTASFAMLICWAAVNVEPTGIRRKKLLVQGTASEMLALYNREATLRQRTGLSSTSTSLATIDEPFSNWNSTTTC